MKKILFGTTAVALVASTSAFAADPIEVGISGGWTGGFLFGQQDDDTNNGTAPGSGVRSSNFVQDSEFGFNGSTTLDNGVQVGVQIEIEGETSSDQIDDSNVWFEIPMAGDVVRIELGGESLPADAAGSAGAGSVVHGGGIDGPTFVGASGIATTDKQTGGGAETPSLNVYSPRVGGFQIGVGMQLDASQGDRVTSLTTQTNTADVLDQAISVGANWSGDFGGVSLTVAGGYEQHQYQYHTDATVAADEFDVIHAGLKVGVAGFTFGAGFSESQTDYKSNNGTTTSLAGNTANNEVTNYNASVTYAMDALSFSLGYGFRENETQDTTGQNWVGDSEETQMIEVGAAYSLGGGVSVSAGVTFFDYEDERVTAAAKNDSNENSGWWGVVSTKVSF